MIAFARERTLMIGRRLREPELSLAGTRTERFLMKQSIERSFDKDAILFDGDPRC